MGAGFVPLQAGALGATGGQRTADSVTGQCRAVLTGHTGRVRVVAIVPDGTQAG